MKNTMIAFVALVMTSAGVWGAELSQPATDDLARDFKNPPDAARPWVYWFFMDGNLTREGMTADLEAMKQAGIGGVLNTTCTFRVADRQPELWDPVTGACRLATVFTQANGCTTVPLEFAPQGSLFVIFRQAAGTPKPGSNFPAFTKVCELTGPWEVRFDPKWGPFDPAPSTKLRTAQGRRPGEFVFDKLDDWSKRPEEGIKFYSGTATYRKVVSLQPSGDPLFLDLGKVAVMARVKLNGKDLGIVWTDPFRVDITAAAKPGANTLEISVVNLWPNRLIGDQSLPEAKRFTWSTWSMYNKDSPLLVSGLLGPVEVLSTATKTTP
jgi:hypothetical protein